MNTASALLTEMAQRCNDQSRFLSSNPNPQLALPLQPCPGSISASSNQLSACGDPLISWFNQDNNPGSEPWYVLSAASIACPPNTTTRKRLNQANPEILMHWERDHYDDSNKACNCLPTDCLKSYCACFFSGMYCGNSSHNNKSSEDSVEMAREFLTVEEHSQEDEIWMFQGPERHVTGCKCKNSKCQKKYCKCFKKKIGCSTQCLCEGCKNCFGFRQDQPNDERLLTKRKKRNSVSATRQAVLWTVNTDDKTDCGSGSGSYSSTANTDLIATRGHSELPDPSPVASDSPTNTQSDPRNSFFQSHSEDSSHSNPESISSDGMTIGLPETVTSCTSNTVEDDSSRSGSTST